MKKIEFFTKVAELIELDDVNLEGEEELAELEDWDSLSVLGFIALADKEFGVAVTEKDISNCKTMNDLCALFGDRIIS